MINLSTGITESTVTSDFVCSGTRTIGSSCFSCTNSGLASNLFEEAAVDLLLSKLNHLLFFGKPEEIFFAVCSPPDIGSRIAFAQIWLIDPWDHCQNRLFKNKLNSPELNKNCYHISDI